MFGADLLKGAGFPAIQGWYATIASPHLIGDTKLATWIKAFKARYGYAPDDYTITSYDAAQVIVQAIEKIAASGKPVTRDAVRDGIQSGKFSTLQGPVSFDTNGDIESKIVSVFQVQKDDSQPLDDVSAQYHYVGAAPTS